MENKEYNVFEEPSPLEGILTDEQLAALKSYGIDFLEMINNPNLIMLISKFNAIFFVL